MLYVILILWIAHYWFWGSTDLSTADTLSTKVTVLIPFKNEAHNLPFLIKQLKSQSYPSWLVEYVFINDHSTDESRALLNHTHFTCIDNVGEGKKQALIQGVNHSKGDLIVMLDADCFPQTTWLETIVRAYEANHSDLIICPVTLAPVYTLWERIQAVEFQTLVASTAGTALAGHPVMCNGANLAFSRSLISGGDDVFNHELLSGDDMFLLEYAKRKEANITYLKHKEGMVVTAPESWSGFWRQRLRWASKSSAYSDPAIIAVGGIVVLANLSLLVLPFYSIYLALFAFVIKAFVDAFLILMSASFFGTIRHLWVFPLILPFYPLYVFFSLLGGFFSRRW